MKNQAFSKTSQQNCNTEHNDRRQELLMLHFAQLLGADHLTLKGGGDVDFEKKFLQALVGGKKLHAAQIK